MKKTYLISLVIILTIAATNVLAEPSAKVTASVGTIRAFTLADGWTPILVNQIKTSENKDLFINVSLECGLTTNTQAMSRTLQRALSKASALVAVRVWVDQTLALPGEVTFANRKQTLIAEFAGDLSACKNMQGQVIINESCVPTLEMLALILDTMAAHSFNYILSDVPAGTHTITVEAMVDYSINGAQIADNPATNAYIGKGSVTIESVRMIKGEDVVPVQ